jgi:hypothetical protein
MLEQIISKIQYSFKEQEFSYPLPILIKETLLLIKNFFNNNNNNKLCIIYPTKENLAQHILWPVLLYYVRNDYEKYIDMICENYKEYKKGEKLILNNKAIVEWVGVTERTINGIKQRMPTFRTFENSKNFLCHNLTTCYIPFYNILKLQKAPKSRNILSSARTMAKSLIHNEKTPLEMLLNIDAFGNKEFIKSNVCLIIKFKSYDDAIHNLLLNNTEINEYFSPGKIDENGIASETSPLLITNSLRNLSVYLSLPSFLSMIIIDGYSAIQERSTDFSDIDMKNVPIILITDLSEIVCFDTLLKFGFDFFNFTKENLNLEFHENQSPFYSLNTKLKKYFNHKIIREICVDAEIETIVQKINFIVKDESNSDLLTLKISLVQLINLVTQITHTPTYEEISYLNLKINEIESLYLRCRLWLGDSYKLIEESISLSKSLIKKFSLTSPEKCIKLKELLNSNHYDFIICPTEVEVNALCNFYNKIEYSILPQIISVANVNDSLLSDKPLTAILVGWAKSEHINRILTSFLFSELTFLFYQFENKYFNSLQRRNKINIEF